MRVHRVAEAALARQQYVSPIDVLCGMGLLAATQVDSWRKGRIDFLERVIQGNLKKISSSMAIFRRWAIDKGLKPSETGYVRHTRGGTMALQFSKSGDPGIEKNYRTHYVSAALPSVRASRRSRVSSVGRHSVDAAGFEVQWTSGRGCPLQPVTGALREAGHPR